MSNLDAAVAIISIAQHASPIESGHIEELSAHRTKSSSFTIRILLRLESILLIYGVRSILLVVLHHFYPRMSIPSHNRRNKPTESVIDYTDMRTKVKRIAVLTSGGDAPGMNACVRAVVRDGLAAGLDVYGVRRGYAGLINNEFIEMDSRSVGGIIRQGGTILMTARAPEFCDEAGRHKAIENLAAWEIDGVVVIGGDGSLHGAVDLDAAGVKVIGVPASIDNDIGGTDMAIGVDTALNTILDAMDKIKDTATAHQRSFLIEVMGRRHGYLALNAGVAGGAEMIILPSQPIDLSAIEKEVNAAFKRGKPHFIVVVAEGAEIDGKTATYALADVIGKTEYGVRVTVLGHVQRGGSPSAYDRILGTRFGAAAVEMLLDGKTGLMTAMRGGEIVGMPISEAVSQPPRLHPDILRLAEPLSM